MALVSIIVPVYNVEKYLARCLDSCLNQTFTDIEILCVNDGSPDKSLDILEHYKKFDSRIKIINKTNGGLSSARNVGVKEATGEYILFVDSDDYISSVVVEKTYNNAKTNNSDVVVFDYISGGVDTASQKTINRSQFLTEYENKPFNSEDLGFDGFKFSPVTTWSKLYRKDLIENIPFCEGIIYEDCPFWAEVYLSAKRITYVPLAMYYYLINRPGCITANLGENVFDIFKVYEHVENSFRNHNQYDKYQFDFTLKKLMDFIRYYFMIKPELKEKFYNKIMSLNIKIDYEYGLNGKYLDIEKSYLRYYKLMNELTYEELIKIKPGDIIK